VADFVAFPSQIVMKLERATNLNIMYYHCHYLYKVLCRRTFFFILFFQT